LYPNTPVVLTDEPGADTVSAIPLLPIRVRVKAFDAGIRNR
jgi:hypothetical protein